MLRVSDWRKYYHWYTVNTKHLYNISTMLDQRRRRWVDVVLMLYKYSVFTGYIGAEAKLKLTKNTLGTYPDCHMEIG